MIRMDRCSASLSRWLLLGFLLLAQVEDQGDHHGETLADRWLPDQRAWAVYSFVPTAKVNLQIFIFGDSVFITYGDSLGAQSNGMVQLSEDTSPNGTVFHNLGVSYPLYVLDISSANRPIGISAGCIMGCVSVQNTVSYLRSIFEKPKTQTANACSACKDMHGLGDAELANHRVSFMSSIDPIDKMEHQPRRDCILTSWTVSEILFLVTLCASVTFIEVILGDPIEASRNKDQISSLRSEWSYVRFSVETSAKGGTNMNITSCSIRERKYGSVRRPLVQMVLFAESFYGGTLACLKSILPKSIVNLYESGRISEKPQTWSINTGSACKNEDDLTDTETENHCDPDSSDHGIIEAEYETAATWLIDTGAVHHATGKLDIVVAVGYISDDIFMTSRDGVHMRVHAHGSVINDTVVLPDVWYVPGLTKNVISASQLNQLGYSIGFTRGTCFIRSASDGTLVGKGHVSEDGLFEMDFLKVS